MFFFINSLQNNVYTTITKNILTTKYIKIHTPMRKHFAIQQPMKTIVLSAAAAHNKKRMKKKKDFFSMLAKKQSTLNLCDRVSSSQNKLTHTHNIFCNEWRRKKYFFSIISKKTKDVEYFEMRTSFFEWC